MGQELEKKFEELREKDPRLAAEYAYVLAVKNKSRYYAQECLRIFKELNIQTLKDSASRLNVVEGVCLPEYIHEGVVRARFKEMGILP